MRLVTAPIDTLTLLARAATLHGDLMAMYAESRALIHCERPPPRILPRSSSGDETVN